MRITVSKTLLSVLFVGMLFTNAYALNNGLGLTPAMGFNTWNYFGCNGSSPSNQSRPVVSDAVLLALANSFISSGMKDAGYRYVNYDDCWAEASRNARGGLVPKPSIFTKGIRQVVDSIHSLGLGIGLYGDAASQTCSGKMPGQLNHEQQDADSFVAWGIDYFKYDWCGRGGDARPDYTKFRNCLDSAYARAVRAGNTKARRVFYSICNWGQGTVPPWMWGDTTGNSWRTTLDIQPKWSRIIELYDQNVVLPKYAKPGAFNDADILEVGNGMTLTEDQAHFALWSMMGSPLLAGNDIRNMSSSIKEILINKEIIAVNQDSLGIQCRRVKTAGSTEVLSKKLRYKKIQGSNDTTPDYAVCFFNRGTSSANFSITLSEIAKADPSGFAPDATADYSVRDLIAKSDLPVQKGSSAFTVSAVASHGVKMIRIAKVQKVGINQLASCIVHQSIGFRYLDKCVVVTGVHDNARVTIVDVKGSVVFKQTTSGDASIVIAAKTFSRGIYIVNVTTDKTTVSQNVFVK